MSKSSIPQFRFHPDPLATRNAEMFDFECVCCEQKKTVGYIGPVYTEYNISDDTICLDCIHDGSAAEKFYAQFVDLVLNKNPWATNELDELIHSTPGYICWQNTNWIMHCNSVCIYLGEFSSEEIRNPEPLVKRQIINSYNWTEQEYIKVASSYDPIDSNNPAFYKFKCSKCTEILVLSDRS